MGNPYEWFWSRFLMLDHPITYYLRKHVKAWWGLWVALGAGSAGFITWLLLHLGGFC